MGIFEKASRLKLRFETNRGVLSAEDLWDLGKSDMNDLYKSVNKRIKDTQEENLFAEKTESSKTDELRLEIIKRVAEIQTEAI